MNQVAVKVSPALATGCTVVLKPSEISPYSAQIFAEVLDAAGVPAGVFNLVHGDGPGVGVALSSHPDVDMVSFTGSTRAGVEVAKNAAPTVKRVAQELGGKSPSIVLDDDALAESIEASVASLMLNSGQACSAPSRMLVPSSRMDAAVHVARAAAEKVSVGDPMDDVTIGPVVSKQQFDTEYGLAGEVHGKDMEQARAVARRIRAGAIYINGGFDLHAPFGGYKKSGNGREWGEYGFDEYLETKAVLGYAPSK